MQRCVVAKPAAQRKISSIKGNSIARGRTEQIVRPPMNRGIIGVPHVDLDGTLERNRRAVLKLTGDAVKNRHGMLKWCSRRESVIYGIVSGAGVGVHLKG